MTFKKKHKDNDNKGIEAAPRGRPTATMTPSDAATQGLEMNPRDPNADTRPPRVPVGQGLNLDTGGLDLDKESYYYHWVLEMPDRPGGIQKAKAAYYEHVTDASGNIVTRPAGGGFHYLMRLPVEYRKEDLVLKKNKVLATMDAETRIGPGEYAPDPLSHRDEGGQSAVRRETSDNPYS